jgi:hypothetical protein
LLDDSLEQTLSWCEHVVIAQKLTAELTIQVNQTGLPVTDLVDSSLSYSGSRELVMEHHGNDI